MAFTFTPSAQATSPISPGAVSPASGTSPDSSAPSVPDSPFLFIQQRGRDFSITAYIQLLLLLITFLAILSAVTIFIYGVYLKSSVASKKEEIANAESTFQDFSPADMKRLSDRATGVNALLQGYVSIRSPLKFLEDVVEKQVVFNEFSLKQQKGGGYIAGFTAITNDYPTLIQQLGALKLTQYSKVAPESKLDKFTEDKKATLRVRIVTPVFVQGVLPDDIVFLPPSSSGSVASSTAQAINTPIVNTATASTTPQ